MALGEVQLRSRREREALEAQCLNLAASLRDLSPLLQQISSLRDIRALGVSSQCPTSPVDEENLAQRAEVIRQSFRQAHAYACGNGKMLRTPTMPSAGTSTPNFRRSMRAVGLEKPTGSDGTTESEPVPSTESTASAAGPAGGDSGRRGLGRLPQHRPSFFMDDEEDEESDRRQWRSMISRGLYLLFGVTDGDARLGILKSHCIHPASPFYRGLHPNLTRIPDI